MLHKERLISLLLLILTSFLVACNTISAETAKEEPAILEPIAGTEFNQVILTERAVQRLGIEMGEVTEVTINNNTEIVVPYAAVIYGLFGETWVYVNAGIRTYAREPITIHAIEGDWAIIDDTLDIGTEVVTVGVAELYGTDTGVGK